MRGLRDACPGAKPSRRSRNRRPHTDDGGLLDAWLTGVGGASILHDMQPTPRQTRADSRLAGEILAVLSRPTGLSSSGYPFLQREAWELFRDRVPHLFGMGLRVLKTLDLLEQQVGEGSLSVDDAESFGRAAQVARQVVLTSAITAPPDLWLLRHVLGYLKDVGLLEQLLDGSAIYPDCCTISSADGEIPLDKNEIDTDLRFLLSRGIVEQYDDSYRIAGHPRVRTLLAEIEPLSPRVPVDVTRIWRRLFQGETLEAAELEALLELSVSVRPRRDPDQNHWIPTPEEVELGYRLVPVVLGLRASERTERLVAEAEVSPGSWSERHPVLGAGAMEILAAAGWMERVGERYRVTPLGERGFARGPGPFGIIETYHPYMAEGASILVHGTGDVWVRRGENVGASQDANRATFQRANDALDRFCADTGFTYRVFIEHAIGRGEATRQRFGRSGEESVRYFGADLEDASIDAALEGQSRGELPKNMIFVRQADIGEPDVLLQALAVHGVDPKGAVMLVGNGFHEVRGQTDEGMVRVFRGYREAGIVLLFTEENALSIDDLRATAWNTYHAGFKYVHEKSGQGLRPADPRPPVRLGKPLRAAWSTCAQNAGYVRADRWCGRNRTIYPYPPPTGCNPAISVNHFFIPRELADELGVSG